MAPEQTLANIIVRASAGSGKTYQLTRRYLALLAAAADPAQILATTFTRKAAREILDRLLADLAQSAQPAQSAQSATQTGLPDQAPLLQAGASPGLALLRQLVGSLHRLQICTLDSFFGRLAGAFGLELRLPPGWRIAEAEQDARLRTEALRAVLREGDRQQLLAILRMLSRHDAGRGVRAVFDGILADLYPLYLETPRPAEADLDWVPEGWRPVPCPAPLPEGEVARLAEALREMDLSAQGRLEAARAKDLALLAEQDWAAFISKGIAAKIAAGETTYHRKELPAPLSALYRRLLEHARGTLLTELNNNTAAAYRFLHRFHTEYERLKQEHGELCFEDITRRLATRAQRLGSLEEHAFRLDGPVQHLLLDEFQDTSRDQWRVLRPYAQRILGAPPPATGAPSAAPSEPGPRGTFFCVGDTKQAIYGWRGGDARIFEALEGELLGLRQEELSKSYRSSQVVLTAVNRIFQGLQENPALANDAPAAAAWVARFPEHDTAKRLLPGYFRLEQAALPAEAAMDPEAAAESEEEDEPQSDPLRDLAVQTVVDLAQRAPGRSIGILLRANRPIPALIQELKRRGVQASEEGGNPIAGQPAVALLLSLLTLADHPADSLARFHVAASPLGPKVGLGLDDPPAKGFELAAAIRARLLREGYGPTLSDWVRLLAPEGDEQDLERLRQLLAMAGSYEPEAGLRPSDFVARVRAKRIEDPAAASVRVMTIHAAKGLEFDAVVLPDLGSRLLGASPYVVVGRPSPLAPVETVCRYAKEDLRALMPPRLQELFQEDRNRRIQEALCVLYVALTRAIHAVYALVPAPRSRGGAGRFSCAGILRCALLGQEPQGSAGAPPPDATDGPPRVLYQAGNPDWFDTPPASAPAPAPTAASATAMRTPPDSSQTGGLRPPPASDIPPPRPAGAEPRRRRKAQTPEPSLFDHLEDGPAATRTEGIPVGPRAPTADPRQVRPLEDTAGGRPGPGAPGIVLAPPREQRTRNLPRLRASSLEGGSGVRIDRALRLESGSALNRGTLLHAWFEQLEWIEAGLPPAQELLNLGQRLGHPRADLVQLLDHFQELLAQPVVREALSREAALRRLGAAGGRRPEEAPKAQLEVWRERPFLFREEGRLYSGTLDRLVLLRGAPGDGGNAGRVLAAEILDFKTDRLEEAGERALESRTAYYRPQQQVYRKAVERLTGLPAALVSARLLFVSADLCVELGWEGALEPGRSA